MPTLVLQSRNQQDGHLQFVVNKPSNKMRTSTLKVLGFNAVVTLCLFAGPKLPLAQSPSEVFQRLPSVEVPGQQIGWQQNGLVDAFTLAVDSKKPLIVVFGSADSEFTQKLGALVMPCPHVNQLAGAAIFVYGSPLVDEYARRMALHLKLTDFPTISVIAPRTDTLQELYRMEGFFDAETIANDLRRVLIQHGHWPKAQPKPAPLPRHPLAYPGKACTPEGARRLGIGTVKP